MAKKGKSQLKRKAQKTSQVKISNKNRNRAAKQGKLKKKQNVKNPQLEKTQHARPIIPLETVEELPLEEDDVSFYGTPGRNISFLSSISKVDSEGETPRQKRKRKKDEEMQEDSYEQVPRKQFKAEKVMQALLPIKSKKGIIQRMVECDEPKEIDEGIEDMETEEVEEQVEPLPELSTVELYALRQNKLKERKDRIARLGSAIMENPEENVTKLRELRGLMDEPDSDIFITIRKYAMISLMEIFKDILPDYRIRVQTEKEKEQKQKKETAALRDFEQTLVRNYQLYLQFLERMIEGNKKVKKKKKKYEEVKKTCKEFIPEAAEKSLRDISIQCMCSLLASHPEFNFRSNMIATLVPFMNNETPEIADQVCDCFKEVLKADKMGEISLEMVRLASKYIKSKSHQVKPKVLNVFLSLRIKEVDFEHTKTENKAAKHERLRKMSKRERKRNKKMVEVNKELQEAAVSEDKNKRIRLHTQILEAIFVIYFRILKKGTHSVLLSTVLEGLAKFAHLINIEFFGDLFAVISDLLESGNLTFRECLNCVKTAFTILTGQGSALNIDPIKFYTNFYSNLLKLHLGRTSEDCLLVLECIEMMFNKRRKQVNQQRALAFIKRLATLALQQEPHSSIGLMASMRLCIHAFPRSDLLFDNEGHSSGIYLPELEDPEHCNAENTQLWELHLFRKHYHPIVRIYSEHLCKGAPLSGDGQLQPGFKRPVSELFAEYKPSGKLFYPPVLKSNKKVKQRNLTSRLKDKVFDLAEDSLNVNSDPNGINFYQDYMRTFFMNSSEGDERNGHVQ
ncbi:nucleolar complex protein 3 homolog [Lineus longissimus]|uniref:nucleolar complex protein 3 homolog n=1 Tax=Lineus longissimus TaxID=88925 RepID=UPI002B4E30DD